MDFNNFRSGRFNRQHGMGAGAYNFTWMCPHPRTLMLLNTGMLHVQSIKMHSQRLCHSMQQTKGAKKHTCRARGRLSITWPEPIHSQIPFLTEGSDAELGGATVRRASITLGLRPYQAYHAKHDWYGVYIWRHNYTRTPLVKAKP